MDFYIAKEGDRLDIIYYRFYGDFSQDGYRGGFDAFCIANPHLLSTPILKGGEKVYLPDFLNDGAKNDNGLGI